MYIKKLISVIIMWSLVISFFAYIKPMPVYAENIEDYYGTKYVPFVQGKGRWNIHCQGIRVYVGKDNDNKIERSTDYNKCIDILKSKPSSKPKYYVEGTYSLSLDNEEIEKQVTWVDWENMENIDDAYKPDKIYVDTNFEASFVKIYKNINGEDSATENYDGGFETFTVNNVCNIILRKYSSGKDGFTGDGIKNIWRLLGVENEKKQEKLIKDGYYLVVEPLIWTKVPIDDGVRVYGTLKSLIEFDRNPIEGISAYQLFSGAKKINEGEYKYDEVDKTSSIDKIGKITIKDRYKEVFGSELNNVDMIKVEQWNLLYAMALSTSREKGDSFGKDVADIFAQYIRWYGNNYYYIENDSDDSIKKQKWYFVQYATAANVSQNCYDDFTSEDWRLEEGTIQGLYDAIIEQGYYRIKCKTDILVSTVDGPYTTDSDVYTTVKLTNISGNDIDIGNITSQFSASYPIEIIDSSGTNAFNTTHLADNETACISIKWHTPSSPTTLNFTVDVDQENNDPTAVIVSPVEFDVEIENQTAEEDYSNIGADISDVFAVNKNIKEKYDSIYSVPYYENTINENIKRFQDEYDLNEDNEYHSETVSAPEFVKDNQMFQNNLNFYGYPLDIQSYISEGRKIYDGNTIKSGYGIGISLDYNGNNDMMTYKSAKLIILYPEYGYDMKYASVGDYSEIYNKYMLKSNPVSSYESSNEKSRVHFIPEWWQDNTEYKIYWILTDMWTPTGEICIWGNISFNIDGSFYDDWYITRNIGDD